MSAIVSIVLPIFAIILTGYLSGKGGLLNKDNSAALGSFVFYFAMPLLLFKAMAEVDVSTVLNGPYIATYVGGQCLTLAIGILIARKIFKTSMPEAATHGTAAIYGNVGFLGIALVSTAFGQNALPPAIISTIVNAAINISVLAAFIEAERHKGHRIDVFRKVIIALATNPMLIAPIAGLIWATTGLGLAKPVETYTTILAAAAGPCALFSLGLSLVGRPISEGRAEVASMTFIKLVIHPLITWALALWLLSDQPQWMMICVLMAALPTGANLFLLAQQYNVYVARTSTAVIVSTILSIITLSIFFALYGAAP